VIDNLEAPLGRNRMLSGLDLFIDKLDHFIRINIDHVIVVIVGRQLKNGVARLKVVSFNQARCLKLRENAIHRCQTNIVTRIAQTLIDVFSTQVCSLIGRLTQDRQDIEAWERNF
jgi:hypothetical protein